MTLPQINLLEENDFIRTIGPVFENSPWIAEATWSKKKPFESP